MADSGSIADDTSDPQALASKRTRKPTEKMKSYLGEMKSSGKGEKTERQPSALESFSSAYSRWKEGMRTAKARLKTQMEEEELAEMIEDCRAMEKNVYDSFSQLQIAQVPDQISRQRMDSCSANTRNLIALAQTRMSEVGVEEWDDEGEQARLHNMLDVDYAKSLYSLKTTKSVSSASHLSARSSISERRAMAAADLARKEAELRTTNSQQLQRSRLQAELSRLDDERAIEIKKAEVAALDEELRRSDRAVMLDPNAPSYIPPSSALLDPNAPCYVPPTGALQAIKESLDYSRLPTCEPPTFGGDPLHFPKWKRAFEGLIGHRQIRSSDKLALLEKYLTNEAAEAVSGMFYRSDDQAYNDAWSVLNERFGHPSLILSAFRSRLAAWPKIGPKDYLGIQRFADYLTTLDHAMPHVNGLEALNDMEENKKMLFKLPDWLVTRWGSTVADSDSKGRPYPSFHEFTLFMAAQARIATRPICSLLALKGTEQLTQPQRKVKAFQTSTSREINPPVKTPTKTCPFCKKDTDHYLPSCSTFTNLDIKERRDFVIDQKRCFRCLRTGHGSKNCPNPHQCKKCKGKHPTALHDDNFTPRNFVNAKTNRIHRESETISATSLTMPVWISSNNNPEVEKLVYALIDSQSDTTFVDESLVQDLGIDSKQKTRLKVQTITGDSKGMVCSRISNLRIRGYKAHDYINLPPAYTIDHIPMQLDNIPTPNTVRKWGHLNKIASQLPPRLDVEAGILIGFDCSHAFLPRECITGADTEPFAIKTDLGWGVIGRASSVPKFSVSHSHSNRISTREVPLSSPADALRILDSDFKDGPDCKTVSQEDLKFLEVLENGIKKTDDGHYELPLPFKGNQPPHLPNNKGTAIKRLSHLKRKLERDPELHAEYRNFVEAMVTDGHAEIVNKPPNAKGQEWYIPHHGVLHPQKKKLRVVFDCSAKTGDTCLNDHLLTGPNLISNLVGILCRFRQHHIAITCDIEKMFYQFKVAPEHQDYLRFLWWEQGDITKEPSVYRMKVHLFGAASSPGCANYSLKRLGRDCEETHPIGSKFVQENFYVDDGLISVPDNETAIQVIKEATAVCATGNIRLHKFASNSVTALSQVPSTELAENAKSLTLTSEETTIQRTLGMQWSTDKDNIHFFFSPAPKPATRRGVLSTIASLYYPLGLVAPFIMIGKRILQATCQRGSKWDDEMPQELLTQWQEWEKELTCLGHLSIPRCYHPAHFIPVEFQLHHFADASQKGYGTCSYLRTKSSTGEIHCALIAAKARVAPSKSVSIPRLELTAALVAAEIGHTIKESLTIEITGILLVRLKRSPGLH